MRLLGAAGRARRITCPCGREVSLLWLDLSLATLGVGG